MKEEHWMQLYLQAWWALTHEDDYEYSLFNWWNNFWYGHELYSWWVPEPEIPRVRMMWAYHDSGEYDLVESGHFYED